eukprot:TRINITY_DN63881_c0_g1_i1.p1 TRINITY_DN63881_c0_g1~~TRINITY_DN63881_c0_g1_i1.p1  ORF type:complete len:154 (-),score=14.27 TRINITY_DN63881_c0_g1_i1:172-633(-)
MSSDLDLDVFFEKVYNFLLQFVKTGAARSEAHQRLLQQLGECNVWDPKVKWLCFRQFLPTQQRHQNNVDASDHIVPFVKQIAHLLCETKPQWITRKLIDYPSILRRFFEESEQRIRRWFGGFTVKGIQDFKYGSKALANYALANREKVWKDLF